MVKSAREVHSTLRREVGLGGAVLLGLGSILGTGVFVSLAIATGVTGPSVILAVFLAALVATFNGLSSAQLAANHPVSGGTYEYGYRWLQPWLGFTAGWTFLCAKSASAATAALGFSDYLLAAFSWPESLAPGFLAPGFPLARHTIAMFAIAAVVLLTLAGMRRSNRANAMIVSLTILALGAFVVVGVTEMPWGGAESRFRPWFAPATSHRSAWVSFWEATALMFVAYTGYGRIATLGEEVHAPRRTIPRAIVITLLASFVLYASVAAVAVGIQGHQAFAAAVGSGAAPLKAAALKLNQPWVATLLSLGAITAMLGVLLNLVLGLSRVLLAMGRRGDMPAVFGKLNADASAPFAATLGVGGLILLLSLWGDLKATWSFSAFTVLIYYAITNLAALQLTANERLFPRWIPWAGFVSCLGLAFWVEPRIWLVGLSVIGVGLLYHKTRCRDSRANQRCD
jgi:APA family basic amino acid/polyamine antiporter